MINHQNLHQKLIKLALHFEDKINSYTESNTITEKATDSFLKTLSQHQSVIQIISMIEQALKQSQEQHSDILLDNVPEFKE